MADTNLIPDWLENAIRERGLEQGLRDLSDWARDLNPLEREFVCSAALDTVYSFVDFPAWCPTLGERRRTTERLVKAALGD